MKMKSNPSSSELSRRAFLGKAVKGATLTVLFAVARTVGWISQWMEMVEDPQQRIGRPRQIYLGAPRRDFVPTSQR